MQKFGDVIFLLYLCSRKGLNNLPLALTALKSKDILTKSVLRALFWLFRIW